ncbi:hypothetical protein [Spiroplasma endosymbiont of Lonchoptera lutea]|uniref:hypothetical protein n=1 Tax=Spiroplasma endosymbiont of Lonchoptera lutea TaxID=3066297 RepID=UPI0030CB6C40
MYNDFNSIDDISSVSSMDYDIFTELTTILPSRSSSEQTFFETTINSSEAPLNFLKQTVNEWVQYVKLKQQSMPFKKQLYFSSVVNSELLNKYFQSLTIKEFNHNLSYLRWGLFDRYRIGKLIDINSNFQVNIPLKNYKFLPPSLNMITKFKSAIANAFKSLVLRLEYIDTISNISQEQGSELLKRILWHYLDSGTIKIDNEIHYFSSDSFWIQLYNLTNNKLLVYLNHFLFMEPLKLEFSLYN